MEFTGERFIPKKALGEIETEHVQRYYAVFDLIKDKVVLDAACGAGYGSHLMSQEAKFVYGLDISNEAIEYANEHYHSDKIEFIQSSVNDLQLPNNSVDVVVSFETIEHVSEDVQEKFLQEIKRVLKPTGILIISTPDKKYYSDIPKFRNVFHVKEFYYNEFKLFLGKYFKNVQTFSQGFDTVSIINPHDMGMKNVTKYKFIDNDNLANYEKKYIIAVCAEEDILNTSSIGNMMLFKPKGNYTSRMFIDLGGGFHEDVVLYADMIITGSEFKVKFNGFESLEAIKGLKWVPLQNRFIKIKPSSIFPHITLHPLNCWKSSEGIDYFITPNPEYILNTDNNKLKEIIISGDLEFFNENMIFSYIEEKNNSSEAVLLQQNLEQKIDEIHQGINTRLAEAEIEKKSLRENIAILEKENRVKSEYEQQMLVNFNNEITSLRSLINSTIEERNNLIHERNHLLHVNTELNTTISILTNSNSWKITAPLRNLSRSLKVTKSKMRGMIRKIIRGVFRKLPLNHMVKNKLKDFIYSRFKFILKNTGMYKIWLQSKGQYINQSHNEFAQLSSLEGLKLINEQPGKIAIHLHLYYVDLLEEFYSYFENMPYKYDLYVSIQNKEKKEEVESKLSSLSRLEKLVVRVTPNRGRDVAPMFAEFGQDLTEYDYISHIHSKKSLYTGNQQDGWRKHLLDNLFGDQFVLKQIFSLFKNHENLGLIYPETYHTIPYWAHTWLSNKSKGNQLLSRMGIDHDFSKYLDFSAGTMFWAKTEALMPLFNLDLTYDDFDEEAKQIDGTLAHAIERSIVPIITSSGNTFLELNIYNNTYRFNKGGRNLMQYWPRKLNELKDIIDGMEIVSFDIFDTLITRPLISPDTVFKIIGKKVKDFLADGIEFIFIRKEAESLVRRDKNYTGDCSIDEIYSKMAKEFKLSHEVCEKIKTIEKELEIKLAMPRKEVVEILNYTHMKGKKVLLISDMYLDENTIKKMLSKCNVNYYDELFVSSKHQKRKDTGEMWDYYKTITSGKKALHIGDNEHSDVQIPEGKGLITYHVMNGTNMFYNTDFGDYIGKQLNLDENWGDSILLGPIVSSEFNSPFKLSYSNGIYQINDLKTLGYSIFGPILMQFTLWLYKKVKEDKKDTVLFLAREGYLLKKVFDIFNKYIGDERLNEKITSHYFLTSRRASSLASITNKEDIFALLDTPFEGNIGDLLKVRFGVEAKDNSSNTIISLPNDIHFVKEKISAYIEEILAIATKERDTYFEYCQDKEILGKNIAIVDVGYSGSIQYYLSKLFNQPTSGYYFVTSNKPKGSNFPGSTMQGYFGENENYLTTESAVYKYQLLLESILTSNEGQLVNFIRDNNGKLVPNYGVKGYAQYNFTNLEKVYEGIQTYFENLVETYGDLLLDIPVSRSSVEALIESTMIFDNLVSDDIKNIFLVEDTYCMSDEISVFSHYKRWFGL